MGIFDNYKFKGSTPTSNYVGNTLDEKLGTLDTLQQRHDVNLKEFDKLSILASSIDVDNNLDGGIKDNLINEIDTTFNNVLKDEGSFENADLVISRLAKRIAGDETLKAAQFNRQRDLEREKLIMNIEANGGEAIDFSKRSPTVNPETGKINYFTPKVEQKQNWREDASHYFGQIKEKFTNEGLTLRYDNTTGAIIATDRNGEFVSREMVKQRAKEILGSFEISPTGGGQFVRYMNSIEAGSGSDKAFELLESVGAEQIGSKINESESLVNPNYAPKLIPKEESKELPDRTSETFVIGATKVYANQFLDIADKLPTDRNNVAFSIPISIPGKAGSTIKVGIPIGSKKYDESLLNENPQLREYHDKLLNQAKNHLGWNNTLNDKEGEYQLINNYLDLYRKGASNKIEGNDRTGISLSVKRPNSEGDPIEAAKIKKGKEEFLFGTNARNEAGDLIISENSIISNNQKFIPLDDSKKEMYIGNDIKKEFAGEGAQFHGTLTNNNPYAPNAQLFSIGGKRFAALNTSLENQASEQLEWSLYQSNLAWNPTGFASYTNGDIIYESTDNGNGTYSITIKEPIGFNEDNSVKYMNYTSTKPKIMDAILDIYKNISSNE